MNNGAIIAVLVVIVIAIVGYLAYSQGYFSGKTDEPEGGLEIQLGGTE